MKVPPQRCGEVGEGHGAGDLMKVFDGFSMFFLDGFVMVYDWFCFVFS